MRRHLALSLILLLAVAGNAFAGIEARVQGKIIDAATKQPIPNGVVNLESVEGKTLKVNGKGKADGTYALFVIDGTLKYKITVSAPGYDKYEETTRLKIGESTTKDFALYKSGTGPGSATATVPAKEIKPDPTVESYNEGAALANAGDIAGAIAKFEQAVAAKPDLLAGWSALAKMYARQKSWQKAIDASGKVLEMDDTDVEMLTVQYNAYTGLGDKANAAKVAEKLPKNANALFNDAAKAINAGDDATAEKLLKQAVGVDAEFAQAHYELGMIYVRGGKSAEAKASLTRYLELAPDGKDAPTAKEMMNYLK